MQSFCLMEIRKEIDKKEREKAKCGSSSGDREMK
jgi:hypothetical protein